VTDAAMFANVLAAVGACVAVIGGGYFLDWLKAKRGN